MPQKQFEEKKEKIDDNVTEIPARLDGKRIHPVVKETSMYLQSMGL